MREQPTAGWTAVRRVTGSGPRGKVLTAKLQLHRLLLARLELGRLCVAAQHHWRLRCRERVAKVELQHCRPSRASRVANGQLQRERHRQQVARVRCGSGAWRHRPAIFEGGIRETMAKGESNGLAVQRTPTDCEPLRVDAPANWMRGRVRVVGIRQASRWAGRRASRPRPAGKAGKARERVRGQ